MLKNGVSARNRTNSELRILVPTAALVSLQNVANPPIFCFFILPQSCSTHKARVAIVVLFGHNPQPTIPRFGPPNFTVTQLRLCNSPKHGKTSIYVITEFLIGSMDIILQRLGDSLHPPPPEM